MLLQKLLHTFPVLTNCFWQIMRKFSAEILYVICSRKVGQGWFCLLSYLDMKRQQRPWFFLLSHQSTISALQGQGISTYRGAILWKTMQAKTRLSITYHFSYRYMIQGQTAVWKQLFVLKLYYLQHHLMLLDGLSLGWLWAWVDLYHLNTCAI